MRLKRLAGATLTGDSDQRSGGGRHRRSPGGTAVRQPAEGSRPDGGVRRPDLHLVPRRHQLAGVGHAILARRVTRRVLGAGAALVLSLSVLFAVGGPSASASVTYAQRVAALHWAESQVGKPYVYGGTGPYGYDCSGLVYAAFHRYGLTLPRTTYGMLGSWHLYRVWSPAGGDLAFYGSGHVEIVALPGVTFGALHSGTTLGYHRWNAYWYPTAYYRVR